MHWFGSFLWPPRGVNAKIVGYKKMPIRLCAGTTALILVLIKCSDAFLMSTPMRYRSAVNMQQDSAVEAKPDVLSNFEVEKLKSNIFKIAAATDRGQRMNRLIAPTYQDNRARINRLAQDLSQFSLTVDENRLSGEWELLYSDVELFRSSPFFLAIEEALDTSPGIPWLGQVLGITDPTKKSEMFFKLHQLQVMSWGTSTVGRISQSIDFSKKEFLSSFDTIIFGLTVIPILGWFKLLPTFGGRVVTLADEMKLEGRELTMELQKTKVIDVPGVDRIPLVGSLLMDKWYPVNQVWKLLPWNGGPMPPHMIVDDD